MRAHVQEHIAAMHIVMAEGCTLAQANAKIARVKWEVGQRRLNRIRHGQLPTEQTPTDDQPVRRFWYDDK